MGLSQSPSLRFFHLALVVEGGLAVSALGLSAWWGVDPWGGWRWNGADALRGAAATLPWLAAFPLLLEGRARWMRDIRRILDDHLAPFIAPSGWPVLLAVSVLAGLGEEMFFRAVLQGALQPPLGAAGALAVASLVFGLCHAVTPGYFVLTTLIGAYLGMGWQATGNLLVPVTTHAAYDFAALLLYRRSLRQAGNAGARPPETDSGSQGS